MVQWPIEWLWIKLYNHLFIEHTLAKWLRGQALRVQSHAPSFKTLPSQSEERQVNLEKCGEYYTLMEFKTMNPTHV